MVKLSIFIQWNTMQQFSFIHLINIVLTAYAKELFQVCYKY